MINALTVKNVRLFADVPWRFELAPLSVFCGTNSAGKSTLLKIPLLLRQSQSTAGEAAVSSGRLRLVGPQVDFGSYRDLVSRHEDRNLSLGVELPGNARTDTVDWLASLQQLSEPPRRRRRRDSAHEPYRLEVTFTFAPALTASQPERGIGTPTPDHRLQAARFAIRARDVELLTWTVEATPTEVPSNTYRMSLPPDYFAAEFSGYGAYELEEGSPTSGQTLVGVELRGAPSRRNPRSDSGLRSGG